MIDICPRDGICFDRQCPNGHPSGQLIGPYPSLCRYGLRCFFRLTDCPYAFHHEDQYAIHTGVQHEPHAIHDEDQDEPIPLAQSQFGYQPNLSQSFQSLETPTTPVFAHQTQPEYHTQNPTYRTQTNEETNEEFGQQPSYLETGGEEQFDLQHQEISLSQRGFELPGEEATDQPRKNIIIESGKKPEPPTTQSKKYLGPSTQSKPVGGAPLIPLDQLVNTITFESNDLEPSLQSQQPLSHIHSIFEFCQQLINIIRYDHAIRVKVYTDNQNMQILPTLHLNSRNIINYKNLLSISNQFTLLHAHNLLSTPTTANNIISHHISNHNSILYQGVERTFPNLETFLSKSLLNISGIKSLLFHICLHYMISWDSVDAIFDLQPLASKNEKIKTLKPQTEKKFIPLLKYSQLFPTSHDIFLFFIDTYVLPTYGPHGGFAPTFDDQKRKQWYIETKNQLRGLFTREITALDLLSPVYLHIPKNPSHKHQHTSKKDKFDNTDEGMIMTNDQFTVVLSHVSNSLLSSSLNPNLTIKSLLTNSTICGADVNASTIGQWIKLFLTLIISGRNVPFLLKPLFNLLTGLLGLEMYSVQSPLSVYNGRQHRIRSLQLISSSRIAQKLTSYHNGPSYSQYSFIRPFYQLYTKSHPNVDKNEGDYSLNSQMPFTSSIDKPPLVSRPETIPVVFTSIGPLILKSSSPHRLRSLAFQQLLTKPTPSIFSLLDNYLTPICKSAYRGADLSFDQQITSDDASMLEFENLANIPCETLLLRQLVLDLQFSSFQSQPYQTPSTAALADYHKYHSLYCFETIKTTAITPQHAGRLTELIVAISKQVEHLSNNTLTIYPYGSTMAGTSTIGTDLDVGIVPVHREYGDENPTMLPLDPQLPLRPLCSSPDHPLKVLSDLDASQSHFLHDSDIGFTVAKKILAKGARIPLLEILTTHHQISCDITFTNDQTAVKSSLFQAFMNYSPLVHPLILLIKSWAKARCISDSENGYLNNYSWSLLVVFFLQVKGLLPVMNANASTNPHMKDHPIIKPKPSSKESLQEAIQRYNSDSNNVVSDNFHNKRIITHILPTAIDSTASYIPTRNTIFHPPPFGRSNPDTSYFTKWSIPQQLQPQSMGEETSLRSTSVDYYHKNNITAKLLDKKSNPSFPPFVNTALQVDLPHWLSTENLTPTLIPICKVPEFTAENKHHLFSINWSWFSQYSLSQCSQVEFPQFTTLVGSADLDFSFKYAQWDENKRVLTSKTPDDTNLDLAWRYSLLPQSTHATSNQTFSPPTLDPVKLRDLRMTDPDAYRKKIYAVPIPNVPPQDDTIWSQVFTLLQEFFFFFAFVFDPALHAISIRHGYLTWVHDYLEMNSRLKCVMDRRTGLWIEDPFSSVDNTARSVLPHNLDLILFELRRAACLFMVKTPIHIIFAPVNSDILGLFNILTLLQYDPTKSLIPALDETAPEPQVTFSESPPLPQLLSLIPHLPQVITRLNLGRGTKLYSNLIKTQSDSAYYSHSQTLSYSTPHCPQFDLDKFNVLCQIHPLLPNLFSTTPLSDILDRFIYQQQQLVLFQRLNMKTTAAFCGEKNSPKM